MLMFKVKKEEKLLLRREKSTKVSLNVPIIIVQLGTRCFRLVVLFHQFSSGNVYCFSVLTRIQIVSNVFH